MSLPVTTITGSPSGLLLSRLECVIQAGKGWRARCPHCGGKGRKLAIAEGDCGALLVTCFGCHDTPAILAVVGLTLADLFPERIRDVSPESKKAARQAFKQTAWMAALEVLALASDVVFIASDMVRNFEVLTDADHDRLGIACERIQSAKDVLQ